MSDRNRDDYFDLDNFDETIDSRDYRRRQAARNNRSSYNNRRPSGRRPNRRRNRTRIRNRVIMLGGAALILILLIFLISMMFRGCGNKNTEDISTDTKTQQQSEATTAAAAPVNATGGDPLSITNFVTPQIDDDNSAGVDCGTIYSWKGAGYELFGGSDSSAQSYAETVTSLADKLSGITVYSMIIPNHTEYGLPQRIKDNDVQTNSQSANIKAAYAAMGKSVTPVNAYNYLAEHNKEYIYFNSDHHWTGLGAYYAYKAFADTNKLTPLSLESCTEKTVEGFTGSFSNLASGLTTDAVHYWEFPYSVTMELHYEGGNTETYDSPYYENAEAGSNTYGAFIFGDNPLTVLKSESENATPNKKIAVIKESYGNAFVSYLTQNYSEVHIMDLRSFRSNSDVDAATYCKNNGITDLLFINGVMSANNQMQLDNITAMFQ